MTPKDIDLVQSSFAKVAPIDDGTGLLFYERLFEIAPEVRPLFRGDIDDQGRMFSCPCSPWRSMVSRLSIP